jgi:hypothetical protein
MRIAEAASRTGTTTRLLRYYEEQGLLTPSRNSAGYRDYSETDLHTIKQIRQLLDAGLGTVTIAILLPCLNEKSVACPELVQRLREEEQRITNAIDAQLAAREALRTIIQSGLN